MNRHIGLLIQAASCSAMLGFYFSSALVALAVFNAFLALDLIVNSEGLK